MDNENRKREILRNNKKEMLEIKNIVTEMKNGFDGIINRLDMAENTIPELEDMKIKSSNTENKGEKG